MPHCGFPNCLIAVLTWNVVVHALFAASPAAELEFSRDILPILSDNCFFCHGPDAENRQADLRLDDEEAAHEYAIVPGDPDGSELFSRINSADSDEVMPPADSSKSLSVEEIELLRRWIQSGAKYELHWALRAISNPTVPNDQHAVDHFVDLRLAAAKLAANSRADRRTLIRRASLDLTGLPPSPADVARFVDDKSPTAWEDLLQRLMDSPAYGERMAWDWLDAARYADTNGYQGDNDRTMWPWRDWVVAAFNADQPWDDFTREQIAGDLLPEATDEQILATGFCRNHMINGEGGRIDEENRVEYVMDMSETVGTVWMGLTFQCCRCHDHKFDALTQRDYFALTAFFNQTPVTGGGGDGKTPPVLSVPTAEQESTLKDADDSWNEIAGQIAAAEDEFFPQAARKDASSEVVAEESLGIAKLPEELREAIALEANERSSAQWKLLRDHVDSQRADEQLDSDSAQDFIALCDEGLKWLKRREKIIRETPQVMVMADLETPRKTFILDRGLYNQRGAEITAATPASLPAMSATSGEVSPSRLTLADWLVDRDHPLTARVTVNRVWQMLFGVGLVKTSENFGVQAEYPSHPKLLDWLATDFIESGWSMKHLLKTIMSSETYQRDSRFTGGQLEADPNNRLLARGARFRMPSWMIRDQALAVSGLLNRKRGGPPVNSYQPPGVWQEATFGKKTHHPDAGEALHRRSLYIFWRRIVGPTIFFDSGKRQVCEVKPNRTNTPLHSLTTLNAVTYLESARALAQRVLQEHPVVEDQLKMAVQLVLLRDPDAQEREVWHASLQTATRFYEKNPEHAQRFLAHGKSPRDENLPRITHAAMMTVCLNLLNLDETVSKE